MKKDRYPYRNYEKRIHQQKLAILLDRPLDTIGKKVKK